MEISEVIIKSKETITIVIAGSSGMIANILNAIRKGQRVTLTSVFIQFFLSFFVGLISYFFLNWLGISGALLGGIIGIVCYSSIKLLEVIDMIRAETIYNIILDFIKYKRENDRKDK